MLYFSGLILVVGHYVHLLAQRGGLEPAVRKAGRFCALCPVIISATSLGQFRVASLQPVDEIPLAIHRRVLCSFAAFSYVYYRTTSYLWYDEPALIKKIEKRIGQPMTVMDAEDFSIPGVMESPLGVRFFQVLIAV